MEMILGILGLAFVLVLIYAAVTGTELPPAIKMVILVALGLIILICLLRTMGCDIPLLPRPVPHAPTA